VSPLEAGGWYGQEARTRDIDAEAVRRYLRSVRANGFSKFTVHA